MNIYLVNGKGEGATTLSAFDHALKKAGIHTYNLTYLSSVLPVGSKVLHRGRYHSPINEYGNRMYVVKSEVRSDVAGTHIGASLGWYQEKDGRGMVVEHHDEGKDPKKLELSLEKQIKSSLQDLCKFRNLKYQAKNMRMFVETVPVRKKPVSVIVAMVYKSDGWKDKNASL